MSNALNRDSCSLIMDAASQMNPKYFCIALGFHGLSGFEMCRGLLVWPVFVLGFRVFHSKFLILLGFQSHTVHVVN